MQYLILLLVGMTIVIYVKEKVKDTTGKKQPELVVDGWKNLVSEIKSLHGGKVSEKESSNSPADDSSEK